MPLVTRVRHQTAATRGPGQLAEDHRRQGPAPHGSDRPRHQSRRRAPVLQPAGATPGSDSSRSLHDLVSAGKAQQAYIYIDYLRNGRGTTAIGAYFPRAREGFPVAAPSDVGAGMRRPHHRWRLFSACHLRHSRVSGPLFSYTGSLDGLRTLAIRLAASAHSACPCTHRRCHLPDTRKFLLASISLWPVPAGRTSTSPALSENTRPLSPPHSILAVPRATPITSWIREW